MSDIALEIPDVKEKEILTLLLRHLDLNSSQIAILFSITVVAVKQRMARLSQRAPSDFLKLFSRQL
jgi:DNA-directed RNA polymerase specialized sigma24 family protein